jgi:DNA primase
LLVPSDSQRAFLEKASRRYHEDITPEGVEYLIGRGLTPEAIEAHRLGVVVDPLPGHEQYRGHLAIPYLTSYGIVSIRYRRLSDIHADAKSLDELDKGGPKYLTMPGDMPRIYNVAALERGTRGMCLAEGELDCIIAELCGLPCIALPGANAWQKVFLRLLEQYDQVMLLQDDDKAGKEMADKLGRELKNLRPVVMTGGDTTSFFCQQGAEALKRKVLG